MQVWELKELLEQYDDEQEIRLAFQPSWPLAFNVGRVIAADEFVDEEDEEESFAGYHRRCDGFDGGDYCADCEEENENPSDEDDEQLPVVWITEGGHPYDESPYAPKAAFESF